MESSVLDNQVSEAANCMACKTGQWLLDPDVFDPDLEQKTLFLISKKSKTSHRLHASESNNTSKTDATKSGMDGWCLGRVRYRVTYGANK